MFSPEFWDFGLNWAREKEKGRAMEEG